MFNAFRFFLALPFLLLAPSVSADNFVWDDPDLQTIAGQRSRLAQVAISNDGTKAILVWGQYDGSDYFIRSKTATISGNIATWSDVTELATSGSILSSPHVALSDDGSQAIVIWLDSSTVVVKSKTASISANTATWSSESTLSAGSTNTFYPQVALSADGSQAIALWTRNNGSDDIVQAATASISANSATWSSATDLSTDNSAYTELAISDDGTKAIAVWSEFNGSTGFDVRSKTATISSNTATWSSVSTLSDGVREAYSPEVALSADGSSAIAIWRYHDGTGSFHTYTTQSATASISSNTATWSAATSLNSAGNNTEFPHGRVALSADGTRAIAIWRRSDGSNFLAQSKTATISANTATWSATTDISSTGADAYETRVELSDDGTKAIALWLRAEDDESAMNLQTRTATISANTATWSSEVTDVATGQLTKNGFNEINYSVPYLAFSASGDVAVAASALYTSGLEAVYSAVGALDTDQDNVSDGNDNCPADANSDQTDSDSDGKGNVCDNCSTVANADQADEDSDGIGNVCDNCSTVSNSSQADSDSDGIGDACDNCPDTDNATQADSDSDGSGDACDSCPQDANKTSAGICGCGIADEDVNQDGFIDCSGEENPPVDDETTPTQPPIAEDPQVRENGTITVKINFEPLGKVEKGVFGNGKFIVEYKVRVVRTRGEKIKSYSATRTRPFYIIRKLQVNDILKYRYKIIVKKKKRNRITGAITYKKVYASDFGPEGTLTVTE